jgi:hypothetical protein
MLITEQVPRHSFVKILDYYEMLFRTRVADMEAHMVDYGNPHRVTSDQVKYTSTDTRTVYQHVINTGIHHYYGAPVPIRKTGAQVLAAAGVVLIPTLKGTDYQYVYIDGILKDEDTLAEENDYSVVHNDNYPPGPCTTEIHFHDPADVIEPLSKIQILYCARL